MAQCVSVEPNNSEVKKIFQWRRALLLMAWICLLVPKGSAAPQFSDLGYDQSGNLSTVAQAAAASPVITGPPVNQVVSQSGTVYFSVTATGAGPLSYQWLSNGVPITGATADTLAVPGVNVPTNLVINGNFYSPSVALNGLQALFAGTYFGGWSVGSGNVILARSIWQPAYGAVQVLDLNGSTTGSIYQEIPTVPGQSYYLHVAMAGDPTGGPVIKTNQIWWGSNLLETVTFDTTNLTASDMGWTNLGYTVTATNSTMTLAFVSLVSGAHGPVLDGISLVPVWPAPAAYSVIVSNSANSVTSAPASILFDTDGSGLPDEWQLANFGATGQNPNSQANGDGLSNLQAYLDGVDPANPATFRPTLQLFATPGGTFTVSPLQRDYARNQSVEVTGVPDSGYTFLDWYGTASGTNDVLNLVMTGPETITGVFGQILDNGASYFGSLAPDATNIYTFSGSAGDNIVLRMGAVGFNPNFTVSTATGIVVGSASSPSEGGNDAELSLQLTNTGAFIVYVTADYAGQTGSYLINLAEAPGAFVVSPGDQGGPMTNGAELTGTISLGELDMWSFTANAGNYVILRMGATNFNPEIRLFGPNGAMVGRAVNPASGGRDTELAVQVTNTGSFTVVVDAFYLGQSGSYLLNLAQAPGAFVVSPGAQGGPMTNGATQAGNIAVGELAMWSFSGSASNSVSLRVGSSGFNPEIRLFGPNGALVGSAVNGAAGGDDIELSLQLTNTGTFTVVISSYYDGAAGPYTLTLAQSPGLFVISPGSGGGPMTNGAQQTGILTLGGLDMWSFSADASNYVILRMSTTNFNPSISLYNPNGVLVGSAANTAEGGNDAELSLEVTNSGTFTVVADSYYDGGAGNYTLNLAQSPGAFVVSPGDQGGPMTNGVQQTGSITIGDLDMWSFAAAPSNYIILRMGATNFNPEIRLFNPAAELVGSAVNPSEGGRDIELALQVTNTGSFTVVVDSYYYGGAGSYALNLAQIPGTFVISPGNSGGPMTNGAQQSGNLALGDLDMWSFTGAASNTLLLRVGSTGFNPEIRLFGPNGTLVDNVANANGGGDDVELSLQLTNSGAFTVVISSYYDNGAGPYLLNMAQIPGAFVVSPGSTGGALADGAKVLDATELGGLGLWTFNANAGDSVVLRCGNLSGGNYYPWLQLFGPQGALLASDENGLDALITYQVTNTGTFTVVVSSYYWDYSGSNQLCFAQIPGSYIVPPGYQGGTIFPGANYDGVTSIGNEDIWSLTASAEVPITLNCQKLGGEGSYYPWMTLYGPNGSLLTSAYSATTAALNYTPTNSGTFTVLVGSYYQGYTGTYQLSGAGFSSGISLQSPAVLGTNFTFTGIGGPSNAQFVLYATPILATPPALWTPVLTNTFNATGAYIFTNEFNLNQPQLFFRLSVP
jgi:P pilus assembly chaperone PapD